MTAMQKKQDMTSSHETMMLDEKESSELLFLKKFFSQLEDAQIKYCVLRNYETLPYSLNGSDIDILIDLECRTVALKLIDELIKSENGVCIVKYRVDARILRFCGKNICWWGLPLDVFSNLHWRCYEYFPIQQIWNSIEYHNGIAVSCQGDACLTAFIKEVLANGKDRKNYASKFYDYYVEKKIFYDAILQEFYGPEVANMWSDAILGRNGNCSLKVLSKKARRALFLKSIKEFDWKIIIEKIFFFYLRYSRLFVKPGCSIAVLGTDGSGKSTIIKAIMPVIEKALHNPVRYEHMRPNMLPSIARLFGKQEKKGPVTNPHGSRPSGFLGSLFRISYYSLDYVLGYWAKVYPALVKRPTLFVFDRYFHDYYIDPRRGRICLPKWLIRFFGIFIPSPDIILCLGTDADLMHARKPELSMEEVKRQVKELRLLCDNNNRAVWIDTGCSVEDSVDSALKAITARMAARYAK